MGALLLSMVRQPWALYVTYGLVGGAGIGFAYVCPIAALVKWFPDKKGLMTGLAVAGFGAGALFFAGPATQLMKAPVGGESSVGLVEIVLVGLGAFETESGIGWKSFFVIHGFMSVGLVLAGATLLRNPPEGWRPPGWEPKAGSCPAMDYTAREMLTTPLACMIWLTFIFGATSGLMAIGQWKPMITQILGDARFAPDWLGTFGRFVEPVGILAIFNALGRIFWGKVSDWIDRPRALMVMYLAQGMTFMLLVSVESPFAIFLASALVGMNFGGNFALFPALTADYFGTKHLGVNYGIMFTAYGAAGVLGPVVGGVLFDVTNAYVLAYIFSGVMCFLAAACSIVLWALSQEERLLHPSASSTQQPA
jgi:OFA family oxalate/formate antiporter-like MFS transporter